MASEHAEPLRSQALSFRIIWSKPESSLAILWLRERNESSMLWTRLLGVEPMVAVGVLFGDWVLPMLLRPVVLESEPDDRFIFSRIVS